ncbi:MAG: hypothetical protein V4858_07320 [Pseudomonadota bacterium]
MRRPDQDKFDQFIAPLEKFDAIWSAFEHSWGFELECNPYRKPGRILRKEVRTATFSTKYMIELYLEPIWYDTEFREDLSYTFAVGAHFERCAEKGVFWSIHTLLVASQPIEWIGQRLTDLLREGNRTLEELTPEYITQFGEKQIGLSRD